MRRRVVAPPPGPQTDLRLANALSGLIEALTPYLAEAMVAALATAGFAAGGTSPAASGPAAGPAAFTIAEAAKRAGLSRSWLYEHISAGNLAAHKAGARSVVLPADLDAFVAALPTLKRTATDGAADAAPAAATANPPVGQPRAAVLDNTGAATGDRRVGRRGEPRRVERQADQDGSAGAADAGRRPMAARRAQRAPARSRAAKSRRPL